MNTVTTIHLAGRSYTLEEAGYIALKAYLDEARNKLDSNPDKEEILKDFDLAVAEKCEKYLSPGKNVITADEIQTIIKEMGPVEGAAEEQNKNGEKSAGEEKGSAPFKKLYRIREGEMIAGICTGLAAYFNIDTTLVRVIFIILTVLTHGWWALVYAILFVVVPVATTPVEKANAFGTIPVTAQEILQKAKDGYSNFKNSKEWKRWKQQMHEERKKWKYEQHSYQRPSQFYELMQNIMGLVWFVFILFLFWYGYHHISAVRDTFDAIGAAWEHLLQIIIGKFSRH